tara:strand:+ start:210 stop:446 length:237 start_codon:yes stop_codon:yes gene_type:complete
MSIIQINAADPQIKMAADLRQARDSLLTEVDAVAGNVLRWAELTEKKKSEWSIYRQSLLDVPQQPDFPNTVTWPRGPQ